MTISKKEMKHLRMFFDHCTKLSLRISTFDTCGALKSRATGFLYQPSLDKPPLIITAGHKLPTKGSFIESRVKKDGQTLIMNAGEFKVFYNNDDIDYAYSVMPYHLYRQDLEAYKDVEFLAYQYKFKKAEKKEGYGFAVINDYGEFIKSEDTNLLPTYYCYEAYMELVDQTEHINYFALSRKFQGHEYYEGASGAPILSAEGCITSILIGGSEETKLLRAFRLDNIELIVNL